MVLLANLEHLRDIRMYILTPGNCDHAPTSGWSATCLAQERMIRIASMLVSGKDALQENSDRHLTASWNESIVAAKCCLKIWSKEQIKEAGEPYLWRGVVRSTNLLSEMRAPQ